MIWRIVGLPILVLVAAALGLRWQVVAPRRGAARAGEDLVRSGAARAVAVVAHPDDLEYYAGGTLARLIDGGAAVTAVVATDGERGGRRPDLGRVRREEQQKAARVLGCRRVMFLGLPDRRVCVDADLPARLAAVFAAERPDLVLSFDDGFPLLPYIHPDHQAVGRATRAAWPGPLLAFHTRRPDVVVDVRAVAARKAAALACHVSQSNGAAQRTWTRALVRLGRVWPLRSLMAPAFQGEGGAPQEWFRRIR
jgi:LmbE family N-acetylglucosaminyl deacetylase